MFKIGIIGYGFRAFTMLKEILKTGEVTVSAVCDVNFDSVNKYAKENGCLGFTCYTDPKEMLDKEELDGVFVGTRCSQHADLACLVASYGLPLFLEKPVATNRKDAERLKKILYHSDKTVVSFPLRVTNIVLRVREILESGRIGTLSQVQAYNNVPYGRVYYHDWYRDESETGGLFLQKSTHDFDYINSMLGLAPVAICAMESKMVFKGDMPAGTVCADCPEKDKCPEAPDLLRKIGEDPTGYRCCFAVDTGNQDSGSAIIRYENGLHAVYTQNFVARKSAGKRGARFIGYLGTVEFDFPTATITIYDHKSATKEVIDMSAESGVHFGGDRRLAESFVAVMRGEPSPSTLAEGILSVEMCLAAKESAAENRFVSIDFRK